MVMIDEVRRYIERKYGDNPDIQVHTVPKPRDEVYVFVYTNRSKAKTLRTLRKFAENPKLSFTWYDAEVLAQEIEGKWINKRIGRFLEDI